MPRAVARYLTLHCLTCDSSRRELYWQGDAEWIESHNISSQQSCSNPSCPQPHIEVMYPSSSSLNAQVRASQRAVVYQFSDGTWAQPGTNDPNDPIAQKSIVDGGVRREFYHIREMHDFQHSVRKLPTDELSGYNDVVDFDEPSLRHRDTPTIDMVMTRRRDAALRMVFSSFEQNGGRYDRALAALRERGINPSHAN